jgi:hypothetical protein
VPELTNQAANLPMRATSGAGQTRSFGGVGSMSGCPKADMAERRATPHSAEPHRPMERPTGRNGGCVSAERAMAKIMHGPQRIVSEEIGICYRRFGAANPARFFLLLSGRDSRGPLSRGVYRGSDQGPG